MTVRDVIGYVLIPLVLFIVGGTMRMFGFDGAPFIRLPFRGVGELGMLTAVALLIVGGACLICQTSAGQIPALGAVLIYLVSIAIAATGLITYALEIEGADKTREEREWEDRFRWKDGGPPGGVERPKPPLRKLSEQPYYPELKTFIQFSLILMGAFLVPRLARRYEPERRPRDSFDDDHRDRDG
jgi:hypothetical protein